MRRAAWGLKEVIRLGRRLTVKDYVKTLEARAGLPASVAKGHLISWRGTGVFCPAKTSGFSQRL